MGLTTKFLVDSTNFKQILDTLRNAEELPEKIDKEYFQDLGFDESTDFLVLALLIDLGLIENNGTQTSLLKKFRNKETSKEALASGIVNAYEDLFEDNPTIYESSNDEIIALIQENLDTNKSDIILNYMAKTLKTLVGFVGTQAINSVWEQRQAEKEQEESVVESVIKEAAHNYGNGRSTTHNNQTDTSVAEAVEHSENEYPDDDEERAGTETRETVHSNQDDNADMEYQEQDIKDTINIVGDEEQEEMDVSQEEFERANAQDRQMESNESNQKSNQEPEEDAFGIAPSDEEPSEPAETNLNQQISTIDKAFIKKAVLLQKLGRHEDALSALTSVFKRYENASDPTLYMHASIALVNRMKTAEKLQLRDQLLPIYAKVIERLEGSDKEKFIDSVDHAYIKKADQLLEENREQEALETVNAAIQRFKKPGRGTDHLADFMFKKGELLESMDREEEALLAYEQYLNRFDKDKSHE